MLKIKRKLLAAILAVSIVLSSGVVWSENVAPEDTSAPETDAPQETPGDNTDGDTSADETETPVTEEEALSKMTEAAKSDSLTLYFNEETCIFAVKNNKSGYIWWSTPYDFETDPIAGNVQKNMMASTISYRPMDVENTTLVNTTTLSYEASVKKKRAKSKLIDNGVRIDFTFDNHSIFIPVSITLDNDKLRIRVHTDEIVEHLYEEDKEYKIVTLNVAQAFGAGRADEDGYIFVPDGSGAVINFNNGKTSTQAYQSKVYGADAAISNLTAPNKTEQTYFPVLGLVKNIDNRNEAMMAVVTKGDAYANINAFVSGQQTTSTNSAWFSFEFRGSDTYTMGTKTPLTVFQSGDVRIDDIEICYYFMSDDEVNIADLADVYRNYLIEEKGLTKQSTENDNALTVTTMGGTISKKSVLGFPVDMQTVATSYSQAQEILEKLKELGVDNIQLVYNDFTDSAMRGRVTTGAAYSGKLGGKNDFTQLYEYVKSNGGIMYPGVDFMEYTSSGNGYSFTLNSSKRVTKAYATQTAFDLAFGNPDTDVKPTWTILSPYYWEDVFRKITESFTAEGINTITLQQATEFLYSDFSRTNADGKNHLVRGDSIKLLTDGLKRLNDAGISIMAQECNAYALPYVKSITNVPLYSSNYDLFDYDVPFYQMVIHGYIPYTSKPVNASSNADELRLLSMMCGASFHYELMYNSPNEFMDTEYDKYYYANYEGWLKFAAKDYLMYNELVSSISDKTVTKYTHTSLSESSMEYSDGTVISINTDTGKITVNGQEKNLADYELKGENE